MFTECLYDRIQRFTFPNVQLLISVIFTCFKFLRFFIFFLCEFIGIWKMLENWIFFFSKRISENFYDETYCLTDLRLVSLFAIDIRSFRVGVNWITLFFSSFSVFVNGNFTRTENRQVNFRSIPFRSSRRGPLGRSFFAFYCSFLNNGGGTGEGWVGPGYLRIQFEFA